MSNKRAYPRYNITLDVAVTVEGKQSFFCVMDDFCFGGIYLLFSSNIASSSSQRHQVEVGNNLLIDFTSPLDPTGEKHRLQGRIVRIDGKGMGIAFTAQNIRAMQALQQLSANTEQRPDKGETARKGNAKHLAIADEIKKKLTGFTSEVIEKTLDECDEELFKKTDEFLINADLNVFVDAMSELKACRNKITSVFNEQFALKLKVFSEHVESEYEEQPEEQSRERRPSLSLVDEEEFNDWLLATAIISRLEAHNKESLLGVEKRFDEISITPINNKNNPAGPYALCHTFQHALGNCNFGKIAQELFYQILESNLKERLAELYEELNNLLIEEDIIPYIEDTYKEGRTPSSASASAASGAASGDTAQPGGEGYQPEGMPEAAAPQGVPPAPQVMPATSWGAPPAAGPSAFEQLRLASTGLNAAMDLVALSPHLAPGGKPELDTGGLPVNYAQSDDILPLLSQLSSQVSNVAAMSAEGTDINAYLTSQLQELNPDKNVHVELDERLSESLQFMNKLLYFLDRRPYLRALKTLG